MSSILDAVTKDAARSGSIPSASGGAPSHGASHGPDAPGGGSGPSRLRSAVLVVVLGVALGAGAARMFGGGAPEADDMLTDKATHRAKAEGAAEVAAAPAEPAAKGSKKDEAAHARLLAKRKEAAAAAAPTAIAPIAVAIPPAPQPLVIPAPVAAVAPPVLAVTLPPAVAPPVVASAPAPPPAAAPAPPAASLPTSPPTVIAGVPAPPKAPAAVAPPPVVVATAPAAPSPSIETGSPPVTVDVPGAADDGSLPGEEASDAPPADSVLDTRPAGAPEVSILFVAWSRAPADRMASMRVGSGSLSVVHEGEYVEGLQVSAIHPEAVEFQWTGQRFRVPVRPF